MDNTNVNVAEDNIKKKRGKRAALTTIGYILIVVFLLAVFPVILPPIFGYQTRNVENDYSGAVWEVYSVAYYKECDASAITQPTYIATTAENSSKKVDIYYAVSVKDGAVSVENGGSVPAEKVLGTVRAKTPFIGLATALCFSIPGIVVLVILFVVGLCCMIFANKISKEVNQEIYEKKKAQKEQQ